MLARETEPGGYTPHAYNTRCALHVTHTHYRYTIIQNAITHYMLYECIIYVHYRFVTLYLLRFSLRAKEFSQQICFHDIAQRVYRWTHLWWEGTTY